MFVSFLILAAVARLQRLFQADMALQRVRLVQPRCLRQRGVSLLQRLGVVATVQRDQAFQILRRIQLDGTTAGQRQKRRLQVRRLELFELLLRPVATAGQARLVHRLLEVLAQRDAKGVVKLGAVDAVGLRLL